MNDMKSLNKLEEMAFKELDKLVEKELTPQTLATAKELLGILKCIPEVKKMHYGEEDMSMMESGYPYPRYYDIRSYDNGMSERRGRSPMTGRYTSYDDGRMSGTSQMQPDMMSMMGQLMERIDRMEKK